MKKYVLFFLSLTFHLLSCLTLVMAGSTTDIDGKLVVHFIDVGHGDASFLELPDGSNILIDAGSPAAGPKLVEYLRALQVRKINTLILTHPHDDHIGGIFSVLSTFQIERFYDSGFSNFDSSIYFDYVAAVRKDLSRYSILQAGESIVSPPVRIEVFNPLLPPTGNVNDDSIVLRLVYNNIKILFAGDAGARGESRILKVYPDISSWILKVSHHGADDALSREFLGAVAPKAAIISVAMISRDARPRRKVLARLSEMNVQIYRTDLNGNIILETDGRTFSITPEK